MILGKQKERHLMGLFRLIRTPKIVKRRDYSLRIEIEIFILPLMPKTEWMEILTALVKDLCEEESF